jgi:YesN/AraC family two-component response regulator
MRPFGKLKNLKTLLIDDDEFVRGSLLLFFETRNCYLLAVETAEEGMEALKKQSYDIIITDYKLPGMDGLEFLRRIKKQHPDVMKILITAYGSKAVAAEANVIGIDEFIEKPFTPEIIEHSLAKLIEKRA